MPPAVVLLLASGFALQPPGTFHGDEPVARDGEHWLALQARGDAVALVPATLRLERVPDALLDAPGVSTGLKVAAPGMPEALMFLRGPGLRAGAVEAAALDAVDAAAPGTGLGSLSFRGQRYRIEVRCPAAPPSTPPATPQDCRVVLATGTTAQPLFAISRTSTEDGAMLGDDAAPALLYAGDLDRDGRLDLLFDTTDHYNLSRPTLLLSSQARDGDLVGQVAVYTSVGC